MKDLDLTLLTLSAVLVGLAALIFSIAHFIDVVHKWREGRLLR